MKKEVRKYLHDILDAVNSIENFVGKIPFDGYLQNELLQAAVERKFEVIGEALNRIKQFDPEFLENIPEHNRIIGIRNIIAHGYDIIEQEMVWAAIKNHLPVLRLKIEVFL